MRLTMARLQIVGLKTQLAEVVSALHQAGCVQIENLADVSVSGVSARPLRLDHDALRAQEELGHLVTRIEGLLSALGVAEPAEAARPEAGADVASEARAGVEALGPQVQALLAKQDSLEAELASLPRYEATLRRLLPIVPPSAHLPANSSVGVLVSRSHVSVLDAINERVVTLTGGRGEVVAEDVDAATRAMLIVVPREFAAEVEALLGREDISRLRLPAGFADQPPDKAVAALSQRLAAIPPELAQVRAQLA